MSRTAVSSVFHPLATALSILFVAGAAFGAGSAAPKGDGIDNRVLAEMVAKESFKEFGRSPEGTVLARFPDFDNPEPLGIWVYLQGALRDAGPENLDQATGSNRALWPPYTLFFSRERTSSVSMSRLGTTWACCRTPAAALPGRGSWSAAMDSGW